MRDRRPRSFWLSGRLMALSLLHSSTMSISRNLVSFTLVSLFALSTEARILHRAPFEASAVNDRTSTVIRSGSRGATVVRAAILLDRAHFSPGEISDVYTTSLGRAVTAFQQVHGIQPTAIVDPATWKMLDQDDASGIILVPYVVTAADVAGPFVSIPHLMRSKAKLKTLGYESSLEQFGEKFHSSQALLRLLNPGGNFTRAGVTLIVPNVHSAPPAARAERIVVDGTAHTLTAFDGSDKVIAMYPATIGSRHDPLPVGKWTIRGIEKNPVFHYNPGLFWDAAKGDQKAVIPAGPNNPVGVVWLDLSKDHYGIHGTPEPGSVGATYSHGCIRLTNWDALDLAAIVGPGTPAILQNGG
jgi:lipoprotein-anchoring transpeptidase ErfK/SrfK